MFAIFVPYCRPASCPVLGLRGARTTRETLRTARDDQLDKSFVIDVAGGRNDHRVRRIVRAHVRAQIVARTATTVSAKPIVGSPRFEPLHIVCKKRSWIRSSGESSYILISSRTTFCSLASSSGSNMECKNISASTSSASGTCRSMTLRVIAGRFFIGKRVEIAADAVHRFGDIARAAPRRSLEEHVLDEMRDAAPLVRFDRRSDVGPNADGCGANAGMRFGDYPNAVGQYVVFRYTLR